MTRVSYPGVYIQEVPSGVHTITGVSTSIAAFVGRISGGPLDKAVRLYSVSDLDRTFGGAHQKNRLAAYVRLFFENGGTDCYVVGVAPGASGKLAASDIIGDIYDHTGIYALDAADLFNIMVIPEDEDLVDADYQSIYNEASRYCKQRRALLLADPPSGWTVNGRPAIDRSTVTGFNAGLARANAAVFYPRIFYDDSGIVRRMGPAGAIAGVMARMDSARGVWKAPSGMDAGLRGIARLEVNLTDGENGNLTMLGVNCLRSFPSGIVNWGARTMAGSVYNGDTDWKYIPVRRMALFIEESLYRGTQWAAFEPNDQPLWAMIRQNTGAFMMNLFRQGAFQGSKPDQAFFVKCDAETTTQEDRNNGNVNIVIGLALLKPAEFIIVRIQQKAGQK